MATTRVLSVALLLALCFAACACAAAEKRMPTNRYPSYAAPFGGGNHAGQNPFQRGCSALDERCQARLAGSKPPRKPSSTTASAVSQSHGHAALPEDRQPDPTKAGEKTGAAGSKGRYISRAAMSRDKLCGRFGCLNRA